MKKNTWRYHHFTNVYQELWLDNVQTDGQTEKVTYRGGCPT